jgi:hypothetical protein
MARRWKSGTGLASAKRSLGQFLDCAGRAQRRQRFHRVNQPEIFFQSGVALRLPPQSKISQRQYYFENTPWS